MRKLNWQISIVRLTKCIGSCCRYLYVYVLVSYYLQDYLFYITWVYNRTNFNIFDRKQKICVAFSQDFVWIIISKYLFSPWLLTPASWSAICRILNNYVKLKWKQCVSQVTSNTCSQQWQLNFQWLPTNIAAPRQVAFPKGNARNSGLTENPEK